MPTVHQCDVMTVKFCVPLVSMVVTPERRKPQLDCGRLATRYLRNDPVLTQHLRFHLED
jgi:hypothetical protein